MNRNILLLRVSEHKSKAFANITLCIDSQESQEVDLQCIRMQFSGVVLQPSVPLA
jgi:hypothetical protein